MQIDEDFKVARKVGHGFMPWEIKFTGTGYEAKQLLQSLPWTRNGHCDNQQMVSYVSGT